MSSNARAYQGEPLVLVGREAGVIWLTLNRGDRFNPLSSEMIAALDGALDAAAGDASVRAIVLAASGARLLRGARSEGDARARGRQSVAAAAV